jgi:glucokinase
MRKVAIGIDIGGTNTAIGVVDQEGNVLYEKKPQLPTPQKRENPNMTEAVSEELTEKYIASLTAEIITAIDIVKLQALESEPLMVIITMAQLKMLPISLSLV